MKSINCDTCGKPCSADDCINHDSFLCDPCVKGMWGWINKRGEMLDPKDLKILKERILECEKEIITLSHRPKFNEKEIRNKKMILKSLKKFLAVHEQEVNYSSAPM